MPHVQIRAHLMNNGKIELSCKTLRQSHSRPYDTAAEAKATLVRLGVPEDIADAHLAALQAGEWTDIGEYETQGDILKETGFTAV